LSRRRRSRICVAFTAAEPTPSAETTALLLAWREGQPGALDRLLSLVYDELRRQALEAGP
jgi:hypothetical protein